MKKIAFCISGVIREPQACIPYMDAFFKEIKKTANVDFFIYTSHYTQIGFGPQKLKYFKDRRNVFRFKDEEINNYIKTFNPKKYIIDDERNELKKIVKEHFLEDYDWWEFNQFRSINQFYNGEECNKLKIQYENEHNFKYDIVFRIRPDLFLAWAKQHIPKNDDDWDFFLKQGGYRLRGRDNQIHVSYMDVLQGQLRVGDNYYYGTSKAMDTFFKDITKNSLNYLKGRKGVIDNYCEEPHPEAIWANQVIVK